MARIDVSFILLGVLCLIVGVVLGIGMGAAHDFQYAPVHAHLNLLGWASLALFGLIYKAYPALSVSWLAKAHLVLSGVSAFAFPAGIYISVAHENPSFAIGASFIALGGILVFFCNLLRVFFFKSTTASTDRALA
ncbi:hypothetical protein [Microvirga sp. 2TAF3]|uniref:hypothetical protein n=1 Tax=Microvirga sp. 2TAF3 TaxID=3233014 RepID=UPI003F9D710E